MSEAVSTTGNKKSRKDIIKDITIAFLVILLLLTFFSNTIMNFSLPEVAIQQVQEGNISPMIRGTGTVEASDPYNVKVSQERVIKSVAVTEGSHVDKGDIIYYLEDKESTELTEAESKLEEMTQTYESALFSGDIDDTSITRIRSGVTLTFDDYQAKLKAASDRYDAAKAADEAAQATIDEQSQAQSYTSAQYNYDEATPQYEDAEITYRLAQIEEQISDAQDTKDHAKDLRDKEKSGSKKYEKYNTEYWAADQMLDALNEEKSRLSIQQASNTKDVSQMTTQAGQVDSDYQREMASLQDTKNKTALELERATTERTELLTEISKEIELCNQRDDIEEQKETVEKLKAESTGGKIEAPVAGTITKLELKAGESTSADNEVAVIQVDGKDMVMSFSVTVDQAKGLKVGDIAEPQNAWYYTNFKATLKSIKADSQNPNTKKVLTFSIESPEVQNGQSVSLQIGEKSNNYDLTIPAGAVREDQNGKFILVVKSKSSPLGNRYIASRVDVEVLASDDTTAAISGSLEGDEYVITTTTSLVNSGDQVRLANNNE
ncbi:HlyD family efflux transporter periplasmic adaptor subunit [Butyrivibrio sp. WCD3002]|uniref:HlyD family efflux transporter periplasmic adaptor subunit n=1 Tax=Butyrivibrio sp. WCD3002 TaxID=1280676 RepID=UPI0004284B2E|nr:HlyD family efflux transporter periplasmic adaptor subunit [Butyrivibrio sp. WCD3002]